MIKFPLCVSLVFGIGCATAHAQTVIEPAWTYFPGFYEPGLAGIAVVDLDGNGRDEAVVTGSSANGFPLEASYFFAILEKRDGALRITRQVQLRQGEAFQGKLQMLPPDGPLPARIAVLTKFQDSVFLSTFAGSGLVRVSEVPVPSSFQMDQLADINADGILDILGTNHSNEPTVLDSTSGLVEWVGTGASAWHVGAAQLDQDSALEIVVGNHYSNIGAPGNILDGATHALEWIYNGIFQGTPVFGNFDADPASLEFALIEPWGYTRIFVTSPFYSPISEYETGEAGAYLVQDINADGISDIAIGDGQWGSVTGYTPDTWATLFSHNNPSNGVSSIAAGELDGDAGLEMVFGAGLNVGVSELLRVFDTATNNVEFDQFEEAPPHSTFLVDDVDGDGSLEVAMPTNDATPGVFSRRLVIADAETGVITRDVRDLDVPWGNGGQALLLGLDVDDDTQLELIAAGGGDTFNGFVGAIDSTTLVTQWTFNDPTYGSIFTSLAPIDFNHDAFPDFVGTAGGRVLVIDGADGALLWHSVILGSFEDKVSILSANADVDPATEILVGSDNLVYMVDVETGLLERNFDAGARVLGMNVEGSDMGCRLVLYFDSGLERRRCDNNVVDSTRAYATGPVNFVRAVQDSTGPLVLANDQKVMLQDDVSIVASSVDIGPELGWNNRGTVFQDGDTISAFVGGMTSVNRVDFLGDLIFQHGFD